MRIIVEEYPYPATDEVKKTLAGLVEDIENVDGYFRVNKVGYYYNPTLKDTVFCLPKVVLKDSSDDKQEKVFDKYIPEKLLETDYWEHEVKQEHKDFLFKLSVWIYRAIEVYNKAYPENTIVRKRLLQIAGKGNKKIPDTYLDILLALIKFNQDNRDFLLFTIKNIHSGYNKINWTRTISHSAAIIQDGTPVYLSPINKKKQINFDEELLIIYYSILNYLHSHYGFAIHQDYNFKLLSEAKFQQYINGLGKKRLREIRYKYFSDKAIELWELCSAFFEVQQIAISANTKQYLLVNNFNIVFEAMIDELISDSYDSLSSKLKKQKDGKRVDHLYKDTALSALAEASEQQRQIYYIGDSKYYKMHRSVDENSEYKQYTYAKNIIHYNLELFAKGEGVEGVDYLPYRDPLTEGYEISPNFFISADIDDDLNYDEKVEPRGEVRETFQFKNRLFDRDTLLLSHYDVNFLHVLSLYARDKAYEKAEWKEHVRDIFRERIRTILNNKYDFYAFAPKPTTYAEGFIQENLKTLIGKAYTPFGKLDIFVLALEHLDPLHDNDEVLHLLKENFFVTGKGDYVLGQDPSEQLQALGYTHGASMTVNPNDLALFVVAEGTRFDTLIDNVRQQGKLGVALQNEGAVLHLVEGFTRARYLVVHNKGDKQKAFMLEKTGPSLVPGNQIGDIPNNKKDADLYLVYNVRNADMYMAELDLSQVTKGGNGYNPQLHSLGEMIKDQ